MLETVSCPGRSGKDVGAGLGDIMSLYVPDADAAIMRRRYNLSGVMTFVTWSTRMGRTVSSHVRDSPDNRAPEAV